MKNLFVLITASLIYSVSSAQVPAGLEPIELPASAKVALECKSWEPNTSKADMTATFTISEASHDGNDYYGAVQMKTPDFSESFSFQVGSYEGSTFLESIEANSYTEVTPSAGRNTDAFGNDAAGMMYYYPVRAGQYEYKDKSDGQTKTFKWKEALSFVIYYNSKRYSYLCEY